MNSFGLRISKISFKISNVKPDKTIKAISSFAMPSMVGAGGGGTTLTLTFTSLAKAVGSVSSIGSKTAKYFILPLILLSYTAL